MTDVFVEKDNVNDETVMVVEIHADNDVYVSKGQMIVEIETSKAIIEIEAPKDGFLELYVAVGQEVEIGERLFSIADKKNPQHRCGTKNEETKHSFTSGKTDYLFTKAAERKLNELGISNFESRNKLIDEEEVLDFYSRNKSQISQNLVAPSYLERKFKENDVVLLGGGGHAKSIIDIIDHQNKIKVAGICSEDEVGSHIREYEVLGNNEILEKLYEKGLRNIIIAFGSLSKPSRRDDIYSKLKRIGFSFPKVICPTANIEKSVSLGEGTQVFMGSNICSDVEIAENCIINTASAVSHDCKLSKNVHITPGAVLAGSVSIGKNSLIGMLSSVYLGVNIGENVIIHNNTRITKNIKSNSVISEDH